MDLGVHPVSKYIYQTKLREILAGIRQYYIDAGLFRKIGHLQHNLAVMKSNVFCQNVQILNVCIH